MSDLDYGGQILWPFDYNSIPKNPLSPRATKKITISSHCWRARYTSQALLTEKELITAVTHIDLNPIRAAIAETTKKGKKDKHPTFIYHRRIKTTDNPEMKIFITL